jgi:hypothetical protein
MNERIKELAEHCDFYVGNEHYDKPHEEQQRLLMEKFAELIVQECAGRVDWILAEGGKTQGDLIKQHFGVE